MKKIALLGFAMMIAGSVSAAWDNGKSLGFKENGELLFFLFDENVANKISGVQDLGIRYDTMRAQINNAGYSVSFNLNESVFSNFDSISDKSTLRWGVMGYAQGFEDPDYGMMITTNAPNPHAASEGRSGLIDTALDVQALYLAKVNVIGGGGVEPDTDFAVNNAVFGTEANNRYIGDPGTLGRSLKQSQPYDTTAGVNQDLAFYNLVDDFSATGFSTKFLGNWHLDLASRILKYEVAIPDLDADGVLNGADNCPYASNADQLNTDGDAQGNACDDNDDNDANTDAEEVACSSNPLDPASVCGIADSDSDGVADSADNCPSVSNADQLNTDGDAQGNVCDTNDDNDAYTDEQESACGSDPLNASSVCVVIADADLDGVQDSSDNCPAIANSDQLNTDGDVQGNVCDANDDNDANTDDEEIACASNPVDASSVCPAEEEDVDTDLDGVIDTIDNCDFDENADQQDSDNDGEGNVCDDTPYQNQTITLTSSSAQDGFILESTEASNKGGKVDTKATTFTLGDSAKNQENRAILHFNTEQLPDNAVITRVTLTIKKQSAKGNVSKLGNIIVDMSKNYFGTNSNLVAADFSVKPGKASVATFKASAGSVVLSNSAAAYISMTQPTQFRLRFTKDDNNNKVEDVVKFYSGNSSKSKPALVIEYYVP